MLKSRTPFGIAVAAISLIIPIITTANMPPSATGQRETKSNQNLIREVRHQLLLLPYYSVFDNLVFKVDGDHVTLEGQVTRPTLKSDAGNGLDALDRGFGVPTILKCCRYPRWMTSCATRSIAPSMETRSSPSTVGLPCLRFTSS